MIRNTASATTENGPHGANGRGGCVKTGDRDTSSHRNLYACEAVVAMNVEWKQDPAPVYGPMVLQPTVLCFSLTEQGDIIRRTAALTGMQ